MKFLRVNSSDSLVDHCQKVLLEHLENGKNVLFLLPGGSNIASGVSIIRSIPEELRENLTLGLTDERYGEVGHPDSNQEQYRQAGLYLTTYNFLPMLFDTELSETVSKVATSYQTAFKSSDFKMGFFGVGADGHIAGVLPGTAGVDSDDWAVGYESTEYTRISLSLKAIKNLDYAVVGAFGQNKLESLTSLQKLSLPLNDQPASVLQFLSNSYIFNDQLGDQA